MKKVRILTKKASQIRASQIRASQIRASEISSNHRELHGAIFLQRLVHLSTLAAERNTDISGHHVNRHGDEVNTNFCISFVMLLLLTSSHIESKTGVFETESLQHERRDGRPLLVFLTLAFVLGNTNIKQSAP